MSKRVNRTEADAAPEIKFSEAVTLLKQIKLAPVERYNERIIGYMLVKGDRSETRSEVEKRKKIEEIKKGNKCMA